jgi:hypothetical protein
MERIMFNKENKNKKVELNIDKLYQNDNLLIISSLVEMINNKHNNQEMQDKLDYQDSITTYLNKKKELNIKKQYNPIINELYHNGIIVIDSIEYKLKDFFIVFDDNLNNFHIKCLDSKYKNEEIEYNRAVRFIDTTAFINLTKSYKVKDKRIIDDDHKLEEVIKEWDGYLHSETLETDAIMNKKMIRDNENE